MKKRLFSLILCLSLLAGLLALPVGAYSADQLNTADALYQLGLFLGTGTTYALDENLTREQGITLLIRMLGREQEALNGSWKHPFVDVSAWAAPYVGCAYESKITDGTAATRFSGSAPMTDQMFLTFCVRALGYADKSASPDFSYDDVRSFAKSLGLTDSTAKDDSFTRGEAVQVFWRALNTKIKGSTRTLAETLTARGVFSKADWEKAAGIHTSGKAEDDPTGEQSSEPAEEPQPGSPLPHSSYETPPIVF